jgi:predicted metalloprotease with PDZ domain
MPFIFQKVISNLNSVVFLLYINKTTLPALEYADYYNFSIASIAFLLTMRYKIYALKALGAIINNKIIIKTFIFLPTSIAFLRGESKEALDVRIRSKTTHIRRK